MRTEFTQTHLLSDGTYETRLSSVPLNYRDTSGSWRQIDNDLVRAADGSFRNGSNSVEVRIPRVANGPVRFADGARALSFSLATAEDDVTAEATGKVARFEDAVGGVDLSYEVVGTALKETLTLASAGAPSVYRFDVESGGLTPRLAASGAIHFEDGDGRRQLGFAVPWMRDANGVVSQAVTYEIERGGESSRIALRVSDDWLDAPERRFPVVVDPTIYRPAEHICEIRSGASASTSYCDSALGSLRAGRNSSGIVHRNLFDLEDLSDVVPDYAQVLSSYLAVYMIGQSPVETSQIDLHHLTRNFAPGATWNSTDGRTSWSTAGGDYTAVREARASTPGVPPDDQLAFDMTELAQRIVGHAEPSGNLLLKAADESRTHLDTYWWPEVMVRWAHRTGLSPRYAFERRELSDGSTLDINLANGNIVLLANDIALESDDGSFTVGRYFNNKNLGESAGTYGRGSRGDFGSISLERNAQDGSYIFFGPGADDGVFHKQLDGSFTPPPGLNATLREQLDGTVTIDFNDSTETWTFDANGRLVQTRQDYGYTIDGTYGSNGLATLRDSLGHAATFAYDSAGDMRTITDEQSAVHRYDYDSSHRLITYTSPASAQTRYAYDSSNRLQRITLPDRSALRISYHPGSTSPHYVTPVDASGVDQPATVYDGDFEYTTVQHPSPEPRNVYFYDPYALVTDLIQTGSAAAIAATGEIPDLDGGYTRGDAALTVDVSAAQVPDGIQLTELEVDGVEVDSVGPSPCDQWTCPTRARETLSYDPRSDPDGTHTYQVNTIDGDNERTVTAVWSIKIDRTPPSAPSGVFFAEDDGSSPLSGVVAWTRGADPAAADSTPGAGIAYDEIRYSINGDPYGSWIPTDETELEIGSLTAGDRLDVELRSVDALGNVSAPSRHTVVANPSSGLVGGTDYHFDHNGDPVDEDGNPVNSFGALSIPDDVCQVSGRAFAPRLVDSDGESDVIVASHSTAKCDEEYSDGVADYELTELTAETCLRMYVPDSATRWGKQVCERFVLEDFARYATTSGNDVRYATLSPDMMCRADTHRYRVTTVVTVGYTVPNMPNPGLHKGGSRRFSSPIATLDCHNSAAFRYVAKHTAPWSWTNPGGWTRVGQAGNVTPSTVLARNIREPRPTNHSNGWHAHHIVPTGYRSGDAPAAQALAYRCRINGNQAENGVWLRGPGLRSDTTAYASLPRALRVRAYHLDVHTRRYFTTIKNRLSGLFSSGDCDETFAEGLIEANGSLLRRADGKFLYKPGESLPPEDDD
jgi:YD repeat-containing protein